MGTTDLLGLGIKLFFAYQNLKKIQQQNQPVQTYQTVTDRGTALNELKGKAGSVSVLIGTRETGKCVDFDTPICLDTGEIKFASECKIGDNIFCLDSDQKIKSTKILATADMGVQDCLEFSTVTGRKIITTPEHPFYTVLDWKKAGELKIGDRIASARYIPVQGNVEIEDYKIKILAYLIGDGGISHGISFTKKNEIIVKDFIESCTKFSDIRVRKGNNENSCPGYFPSKIIRDSSKNNNIVKFLKEHKIYGHKAATKFIPNIIFTLTNDKLILFLRTLYSTDGYVGSSTIEYSSKSNKLCLQLQHLLLRFGILSIVKVSMSHLYGKECGLYSTLFIDDSQSILNFINKIGIIIGKEEKLLKLKNKCLNTISNPILDTIPKEVWNLLKSNEFSKGKTNYISVGHNWEKLGRKQINTTYCPSRKKVKLISNITGNLKLKNLSESDIFWDKIIEIKLVKRHVCDLMTENHTFLANDIVVHNTVLARRLAEFFGRPTYCVSPQQETPRWIKRLDFQDITEMVPEWSTLIFEDLPSYASNRDYNDECVRLLNRIIPMVRHPRNPPEFPVGRVHLIFVTQSSAAADRFILDCDAAFFKPVGLLIEERPNVARIYKQFVNAEFEGKDTMWIRQHAFMMTPTWRGIIKIGQPTG